MPLNLQYYKSSSTQEQSHEEVSEMPPARLDDVENDRIYLTSQNVSVKKSKPIALILYSFLVTSLLCCSLPLSGLGMAYIAQIARAVSYNKPKSCETPEKRFFSTKISSNSYANVVFFADIDTIIRFTSSDSTEMSVSGNFAADYMFDTSVFTVDSFADGTTLNVVTGFNTYDGKVTPVIPDTICYKGSQTIEIPSGVYKQAKIGFMGGKRASLTVDASANSYVVKGLSVITTGGDVMLRQAQFDELSVVTDSGNIYFNNPAIKVGQVTAGTSSGRVDGRYLAFASSSTQRANFFSTKTGNIVLDQPAFEGSRMPYIIVESMNGTVALDFTKDFIGAFTIRSPYGSVSVDSIKARVDSQKSTLFTTVGTISADPMTKFDSTALSVQNQMGSTFLGYIPPLSASSSVVVNYFITALSMLLVLLMALN